MFFAIGAVVAGLAFSIGACGDDEDEGNPGASAEPDPVADPDPEAGSGDFDQSISVVLTEWEVVPALESVKAGAIRLVADNQGEDGHELVICKDSCEAGEEAELAEVEDVAPGMVKSFVVDLEPGTYELACLIEETEENGEVENHYRLGMSHRFVVE